MGDETRMVGRWDETSSNQLTTEITSRNGRQMLGVEQNRMHIKRSPPHTHTHIHYTQGVGGGVFVEADKSGPSLPVSNMFSRHIVKEEEGRCPFTCV